MLLKVGERRKTLSIVCLMFPNGTVWGDYLSSVASRTTRRAFWLPSIGLHLWASNAALISFSAPLNCELQRSQTPSSDGVRFTILSFRFSIITF
jgi:hypothetical protein